jgi:predicted ferric reductase
MLQRKQSLWALAAVACAVLTLKFPFFSGERLEVAPAKISQVLTATDNIGILIITVILIVAGLVNIFNYKNRKLQLRITVGLILLSLLNIYLYFRETKTFQHGTFSLTALFSLAIPLLLFLTSRGIYRDQKLVKSTDRLR